MEQLSSMTGGAIYHQNPQAIPMHAHRNDWGSSGTEEPFQHQPGRKLHSFPSISKSPLDHLNDSSLHIWSTKIKERLATNPHSCNDTDDGGDDDDEVGSNDNKNDKDEKVEALLLEGQL